MRRTVVIRRLTVLAIMVMAMVAFAAPAAWAVTLTVDRKDDPNLTTNPSADNCGTDPGDCSLRGAIETLNIYFPQANTIGFDPDIFPGNTTSFITLQDALTTGDAAADELTINGPGPNALQVMQSEPVRVFQNVGKTTINGITIRGGRSINNAGGILNNPGADLTLNDTIVVDNEALGDFPSGYGGGIYNAPNATLTLNRSTVGHNVRARYAGGIYNLSALTLNNSTVSDNRADNEGGGIANYGGTLALNNSTVRDNTATFGGGIYSDTNLSGTQKTTVTNSTISGNTASSRGGGIFNGDGLTAIEHSTITNNTATLSGDGSGVASSGYTNPIRTETEVLSSIVSANTNTDVDFVGVGNTTNTFLSEGYNRIGDGNATTDPNNAFNKLGDQTLVMVPGLWPLANNGGPTQTHALQTGSPAIDAGPPSCPATDQRGVGFGRPLDGDGNGTVICDIGAYEKAGAAATPPPPPKKHKKKKKKKKRH